MKTKNMRVMRDMPEIVFLIENDYTWDSDTCTWFRKPGTYKNLPWNKIAPTHYAWFDPTENISKNNC